MTALTQATVLQIFGSADPALQSRALELFERLKVADGGWTLCAEILTTGARDPGCNDHVKFFCFLKDCILHLEASAYLSFDGGAPVRVREGQSIQGVRITHINANGVRLMQGIQAKVLEGGL